MKLILTDISQLYCIGKNAEKARYGEEMQDARLLHNQYIAISDGIIEEIGAMEFCDWAKYEEYEHLSCEWRIVMPGFVDSHTHIIFPTTREEEFEYKIKGLSYPEIAAKGGGILNSARKLAKISEEHLLLDALARVQACLKTGTTSLEIKSGYGLSVEAELKMLRVAQKLKMHVPQRIKTTFLGAHAIPEAYKDKRDAYISLVCEEMIPQVAEEKLADYIDVFCETGFFTLAETERILQKGLDFGLKAKLHANQLDYSGGVELGVKMGAISVDHLERCGEKEIAALVGSATVPTLLPQCSFYLREPYAPARALMQAGLPVALASDYNPGSSPSSNMAFVWSLACIQMRMLPQEALTALTLNGANALELSHEVGSIEVGKRADILISKPMEHLAKIPYTFTENLIETVICKGEIVTPFTFF